MAVAAWRLRLQPASFNGVEFHVDVNQRQGGRRIALKEFPKRELPYAEDMGRKARRFVVSAYVIGSHFEDRRDALIDQLEKETNGRLVMPTSFDEKIVVVDGYSVTERRERGGYAEFEINFIEAGQEVTTEPQPDTQTGVTSSVNTAISSTASGNSFIHSSDISKLQ